MDGGPRSRANPRSSFSRARAADRVSVLHYGGVVAEGTPDAVRQDAQVAAIYLGTAAPAG